MVLALKEYFSVMVIGSSRNAKSPTLNSCLQNILLLQIELNASKCKHQQERRTSSWLSRLQTQLLLLFLRARAEGILKEYYPTVCIL